MTPLREQRLSRHFTWGEFFDWHNGEAPPLPARPAIRRLVREVLEPLRHEFGAVTIHSAYRTTATNRMVGGAPHSHHLYRQWPSSPAVDLSCEHEFIDRWVRFLERLHVGGLGTYPTHVHVDQRKARARWHQLA